MVLPVEVQYQVWQCLPLRAVIRLRPLSTCFWEWGRAPHLSPGAKVEKTKRWICYLLNRACYEGRLSLLKWVIRGYSIVFYSHAAYPGGFALEQGHTDIVQYLYTEHFSLNDFQGLPDSFHLCIQAGHVDTVRMILDRLAPTNKELFGLPVTDLRSWIDSGGTFPHKAPRGYYPYGPEHFFRFCNCSVPQ